MGLCGCVYTIYMKPYTCIGIIYTYVERERERERDLMQYGLSLQKASCLFHTATAGDIVFLMQCHVLPAQLLEQFDAGITQ